MSITSLTISRPSSPRSQTASSPILSQPDQSPIMTSPKDKNNNDGQTKSSSTSPTNLTENTTTLPKTNENTDTCWTKFSKFCSEVYNNANDDLKEGMLLNNQRKEVSRLFHTIKNGELESNTKLSKNVYFKNLSEYQNYKPTIKAMHGILSQTDAKVETEQLYNIFGNYNKELELKGTRTNEDIQNKTIEFFNHLLSNIQNKENRNKAQTHLDTIIETSSKISNSIEVASDSLTEKIEKNCPIILDTIDNDTKNVFESQNETIERYDKACEAFMNETFPDLESNNLPENEKAAYKLIKNHMLNFVKTSGMLLTYQPRDFQDKVCIWLKRLFFPIAFVMHQLFGVLLEKYINPYYFAGLVPLTLIGVPLGSLIATWVIGCYGVLKLVDIFVDNTFDTGKDHAEHIIENNIKNIKNKLGFEYSEIDKKQNLFIVRWAQHLGKSIAESYVETKESIIETFIFKQKQFNSFIDSIIFSNKENKVEKFKTALQNHLIESNNEELFNMLFAFQHLNTNFLDESEEHKELIKDKLNTCIEDIVKSVQNRQPKTLVDNDVELKTISENKELLSENNIKYYSTVLTQKNTDIIGYSTNYILKPGFYIGVDFALDTTGVVLTHHIEPLMIDASLKLALEIGASLTLPLVFIGTGIIGYVALKAFLNTCKDEKNLEFNAVEMLNVPKLLRA